MLELRWILLVMGVLLVAALYFWSRKPFFLSFTSVSGKKNSMDAELPRNRGSSPEVVDENEFNGSSSDLDNPESGTERVVTIRLMGRGPSEISSDRAVIALRASGLVHGRYGIFHSIPKAEVDATFFSVASLTEPGSFDIENLEETTLPGMSFFMVLPGTGDPVVRFDDMVHTARALSQELDAELFDDQGSSWSVQRERYIREELIEYRHQLGLG